MEGRLKAEADDRRLKSGLARALALPGPQFPLNRRAVLLSIIALGLFCWFLFGRNPSFPGLRLFYVIPIRAAILIMGRMGRMGRMADDPM